MNKSQGYIIIGVLLFILSRLSVDGLFSGITAALAGIYVAMGAVESFKEK